MPDALPLDAVYSRRFANREARREAVWDVLCQWFDRFIPGDACILDIACGHGEFANHLPRRNRTLFAADINPDARSFLRADVTFLPASAEVVDLPDGSLDVVFASNFFEHLPSAEALLDVLRNAARMLKLDDCSKLGGVLIALQPDIRRTGAAFWDFLDHKLPITLPRLEEACGLAGLRLERAIPRFLPYTMSGRMPSPPFLVKAYLKLLPASGWLFGKQAFAVFRKT